MSRDLLERLIEYLYSVDPEALNSLIKKAVEIILQRGYDRREEVLKEVAKYRIDSDATSAWHLLHLIRSKLSCDDIREILKEIRPLSINEESLKEALSLIESVCQDYQAKRNVVRLKASYLLAHQDHSFAELLKEESKDVGDIESYWVAIRVSRGDKDTLLTQVVYPESLHLIPEEKIPHAVLLRVFNYLVSEKRTRPEFIDKKSLNRVLEKFEREFSAGRNPLTGAYFDRLRVLARITPRSFCEYKYPAYLLEFERLLMKVLKNDSSEVFKNIRPTIRKIVERASNEGITLTSEEFIEQTFVMPWEDIILGTRYRGREIGRYIVRLIALLAPDLKELTYLSDDYPEALFGIHSLYPEEIYVGRYIHVGVEAYLYERNEMIKTKDRIFKKTLSNLVEKFKGSDNLSQAKAASRAISLAEGRAYLWGLVPHLVRKYESATLYQILNPIFSLVDDRLVRLYLFERSLWSAYEGILHQALIHLRFKHPRPSIWHIIADNIEELSHIIQATISTLSSSDSSLLKLIAFSKFLRLTDAIYAIIRLSSVLRGGTAIFRKLHHVVATLLKEAIPLVENALNEKNVFKIVEYPSYSPIFKLVIRSYQIAEALRRAAVMIHIYGFEDDVSDSIRKYVDDKALTAMEPRIFPNDPDVLAVYLPITGGKKFKLHRYSKGT